jgi:hypothetical protein
MGDGELGRGGLFVATTLCCMRSAAPFGMALARDPGPIVDWLESNDDHASAKRARARTNSVTVIAMLSAFQARPLAKAAA